MIRIFKLVLLLIVSQVAFGQAPSNYTNINGRYRWIAGMFDSTFHIPKGTTNSLRVGGSTNAGALFYNTTDSTVYTYTGTQWIKLRGVIVDTTSLSNRINLKLNISDTASMLAPYLRKVDTASLSNRINLKLNISDTATMLGNYLNNVGYGLIKAGQVVRADSATLATYFLRRKDSLTTTNPLGYVTRKILADTAAAIRSSATSGFVPYTGATQNVNLGQFGLSTKFVQFDTSSQAVTDRRLQWSNDDGTLQFGMTNGATITQRVGLEQFARVKNVQGSQINKGQVVYISGASGDRASVKLADNRADSTSSRTLGVATEDIPINDVGLVGTFGVVSNLNLAAYAPGDVLYLDSIPGGLTKTKPQAPYHIVFIGVVERANAGNGQLFTNVQNGYELEELHNVRITSPVRNNALLVYDSTRSLWIDTTIAQAGLAVTQVNTNSGSGITGGPITTVGTIAADTLVLSTRAWRQKGIDSVQGNLTAGLALKLNISDTANMLNPYLRKVDTASLSNRINTKLNISDTATMLGNYVNNVGYGLAKSGQVVRADSATLASYFLRRKDSLTATNLLGYVTGKILADTAAAVRAAAGGGSIGGSGTANYVAKFTSSTAVGNSRIFDDGTNVGIGLTTASHPLTVLSNSSSHTIKLLGDNSANISMLTFSNNADNANYGIIQGRPTEFRIFTASNPITFTPSTVEAMRLISGGSAATMVVGNGQSAAIPFTGIIEATDGSGSNVAGAELRIQGGQSTGSAAGGPITFYTAAAGTAGTSTNAATERMRLDTRGNVGLGVTPSAWNTPFKVMQLGSTTAIWDITSVSGFSNNLYNDGANKYLTTNFATIFQQWDGGFAWLQAPSGTAGTAITFTQAMTLNASGNLGINTTTIGSRLQVNGNAAIGYSASTAAPTNGLQVAGDILQNVNSTTFQTAGRNVIVSNGTSSALIGLMTGGTNRGYFFHDGTDAWLYNINNGAVIFGSNNLERARFLAGGGLIIGNGETAGTPSTGIISGTGGTGTNVAGAEFRIRGGASTGSGAGGPITFYTSAAGSAGTSTNAATEIARITTEGRFGLGVNNPAVKLQVEHNADGNIAYFRNTQTKRFALGITTSNTNNTVGLDVDWGTATVADLIFTMGTVERMRLKQGGSLGIGTTTIGSTLQVNGNAAIGYSASTAAPTNGLAVSGNVGIGTTSPAQKLDVVGNIQIQGTSPIFTINASSASYYGGLSITQSTTEKARFAANNQEGAYIYSPTAQWIGFSILNDASTFFRITSGGLVGIGTNAPTSTLHTNGSVAAKYVSKTATYTLDATDYTVVFNVSSAVTANLPDATTCTGRIYVIKVNNTSNTDAVTIDPNGAQTIDGNATYTIQCQYGIMIQSDGANWRIIADFGAGLNCL